MRARLKPRQRLVGGVGLHPAELVPAGEAARPVAGARLGRPRELLVRHGLEAGGVGPPGPPVVGDAGLGAGASARENRHVAVAQQKVRQRLQLLRYRV